MSLHVDVMKWKHFHRWPEVSPRKVSWTQSFVIFFHAQTIYQTVQLAVIWDAMTLMWHHCGDLILREVSTTMRIIIIVYYTARISTSESLDLHKNINDGNKFYISYNFHYQHVSFKIAVVLKRIWIAWHDTHQQSKALGGNSGLVAVLLTTYISRNTKLVVVYTS